MSDTSNELAPIGALKLLQVQAPAIFPALQPAALSVPL
jgi:hypothetical protein